MKLIQSFLFNYLQLRFYCFLFLCCFSEKGEKRKRNENGIFERKSIEFFPELLVLFCGIFSNFPLIESQYPFLNNTVFIGKKQKFHYRCF